MLIKEAKEITGGLSDTEKLPCKSINLPARACRTGLKLRKIKGSVCSKCYACKGRYVFKSTQDALMRRLKAIGDPNWVEGMKALIAAQSPDFFRFHDSGDIQGVKHLEKIMLVVQGLPETKFWLPTLEHGLVAEYFLDRPVPANLSIRLSTAMLDGKPSALALKLMGKSGFGATVAATEAGKGYKCPATWGGTHKCGDCRTCWDSKVKTVIYKKH